MSARDEHAAAGHAPSAWVADLRLDPTAWIAPGAVVTGDITLGARASVWFHSVLRGDTAPVLIGDDSNVQDNSVVHVDEGYPARVGARVTVGHRAIIHGCSIEDDCLIGMGAIVLTGARVGRGSLVGAGALVREGQEIPPGSLALGAPARVIGPVTAAHLAAIQRGAAHYAELSGSYLRRGFARPHPPRRSDPGTTGVAAGPMTWLEWERLLEALAGGPAWAETTLAAAGVERARRAPRAGAWSALEVIGHLRDGDTEVFVPRLTRLLVETEPRFDVVRLEELAATRGDERRDPADVIAAWRTARGGALRTLRLLGAADWTRLAFHATRGPYPLADLVRAWAEHDLSHRRQIAVALADDA